MNQEYAKAEECTAPYKQFTNYLLPFLMNTNTSETIERACREDGWHPAAIATVVTLFISI